MYLIYIAVMFFIIMVMSALEGWYLMALVSALIITIAIIKIINKEG